MDIGASLMEIGTGATSSLASMLLKLAAQVPATVYILGSLLVLVIFVYLLFDFHVVGDVLRGCRGDKVTLTFNPASEFCQHIVSKCRVLHSRYLVTPWLASPHIQTAFLHFFGNPPKLSYRRQIFPVSAEEVVALDWLLPSDVVGHHHPAETTKTIAQDGTVPIVVVLPGLTSDSSCSYVQHLVYKLAKRGWNVVVSNHRGLGGIPVKSELRYNAGFTDDIRKVIQYLHHEYPRAPLFAVGTSMGANLLVKYLGEDGKDTPLAGASSICSPWDFVICERFLSRGLISRCYNRALAFALKDYARLNQSVYSKFVDWETVRKAQFIRDFDGNVTCPIMNFLSVDTYYRQSSSVNVVSDVSIPLLCVNALDDPVCSKEVIPWDECRANKNIVLATAPHGGHLAFFKGMCASSLWWVEAVDEFLGVLHSSPFMRREKKMQSTVDAEVRVMINGGVNQSSDQAAVAHNVDCSPTKQQGEEKADAAQENTRPSVQGNDGSENQVGKMLSENKHQVSKRSAKSIWILAYIALTTTWPLVGPILAMVFKRKYKSVLPAAFLRR